MGRLFLSLALLLAAVVAPAHAEQAVQFDKFVVHYNAFNADVLDPKVASSYGIQRSQNRGVLMVSVQQAGAQPSGQRASVTASAQTQNLQAVGINVREVKEGDSYYYLADFPVTDGQTLDFKIAVQPEGAKASHTFAYRQQFFTSKQ